MVLTFGQALSDAGNFFLKDLLIYLKSRGELEIERGEGKGRSREGKREGGSTLPSSIVFPGPLAGMLDRGSQDLNWLLFGMLASRAAT